MARTDELDGAQRRLLSYLAVSGPASAPSAASSLGVSQPVFSRLVARTREHLLIVGKARATRYAARRVVSGAKTPLTLYEIDADGAARRSALLHPCGGKGFYVEALNDAMTAAFYDDFPYFLHDLRPQGFMGRTVPSRHPDLDLPPDVRLWSGDQCIRYLTRYGWNLSGNLILGDGAFALYMEHLRDSRPEHGVTAATRAELYPRLAVQALSVGLPGSSAAGEQPKFLATRLSDGQPLIVKFSPPVTEAAGRRVAELLVCEHLAHGVLNRFGHAACKTEIIWADDRAFLEVERFDRLTSGGRRGLLSLFALDAQYVGRMQSWTDTAAALRAAGIIDAHVFEQVRYRELFGHLIANTDMHLGNVSVFTRGNRITGLAPAYDTSPMLYSPQHGHLTERTFAPPTPLSHDAATWSAACDAAAHFWNEVAAERSMGDGMRRYAAANASTVVSLQALADKLPKR